MTTIRTEPSVEEAHWYLSHMLGKLSEEQLHIALSKCGSVRVRSPSNWQLDITETEDMLALLFYKSGWIRKESGGRVCFELFLLSDGTWIVQQHTIKQDPVIMLHSTDTLLPILQEVGFYGSVAASSVQKLLKIVHSRTNRSLTWTTVCRQIKQLRPPK